MYKRQVLYNTSGGSAGERASYDFGGGTLVSVSNTSNGAALLLSNGQTSTAVLLDGELTVGYSGSVLLSLIHILKMAGIYEYRERAPHNLSGGQKQRVAIAGVVAMRPDCLILDEATAMLDPRGLSLIHISHCFVVI